MENEKKLQISIGIESDTNNLIVKFSDKVEWLSFTANDAINFSNLIKSKAEKILNKEQKK